MSERRAALLEAAEYAEFYAEERMRLCTDAILHDPVLHGKGFTRENLAKSADMQLDSTINSAAYHAAHDLAKRFRELAALSPGERG